MRIIKNISNLLSKFKSKKVYIPTLLLLAVAVAGFYFVFLKSDTAPDSQEPTVYHSKLTGLKVTKEDSEKPILGVMIENSVFARPQTGLDSAGIVFEAVTEGGITRFLALYQEDQPELVGPVRSLRTHFLNWSMGFDASVAHVGGSAEALKLVDERKAMSMNQFNYPEPYFRTEDREPPHNVYSKTADLNKLQEQLNFLAPSFDEIPRIDDSTPEKPTAKDITIDFSGPDYLANFKYNLKTNTYARSIAGEPAVDVLTNKAIQVKNLIIIKTEGLSAGVQAIGSGEALVFNNGIVTKGTWKLEDFNQRIKFFDGTGAEIPLVRGDTWIAAPAKDRTVTY